MARLLKENDIKPVLKLCTNDTKELVLAGVNGDEDFPKLLSDYRWSMTRDYNMAVIIVAFYTYCLKSDDSEIKRFALSALKEGSNSNKLFEFLKEGNGKKIKDCMRSNFMIVMDKVLQGHLVGDENKEKRAKIVANFRNRAGKITSWYINGGEISNLIDKLLNKSGFVKSEIDRKAEEERKAKEEAERKAAEERKAKEEAERKAAEEKKAKEEAEKRAAEENKRKETSAKKPGDDITAAPIEPQNKEEQNERYIKRWLEDAALAMQHCDKSLIIDALKFLARQFKFLKKDLGESNYKKQLKDILERYSKQLSSVNKSLSENQKKALFDNIINVTAEICDGYPYFGYFVNGQKKKIKIERPEGVIFGDLVDFESLKNKCPIAVECNVVDHDKVTDILTTVYEIPSVFRFLVNDYFGKNGPTRADFGKDLKFKLFTWRMIAACKYVELSFDLMICLSELNIITG